MHISTPSGSVELAVVPNTGDGELFSNVSINGKRNLPVVIEGGKPAIICGGGPSLADTLEKVRELAAKGAVVYALNNSAKFLAEKGIAVHGQIIIDAREANVEFVKDSPAEMLYLASQCHPSLFEAAQKPVMLWHPRIEGMDKYLPKEAFITIGGGTTAGLSGMCLVHALGHREIHLFGYDSCHKDGKSHAYDQPLNAGDDKIRMAVNNRVFYSSVTMAAQANKFMTWANCLAEHGAKVHVHGDGLLQHIVKTEAELASERVLNAVYDLGSSPPTYDFLTFLVEAEKYRQEKGYTSIDVTFMPGPMYGFRDDNLPPSVAEREGMLHRVCVSACRLLRSVRNVTISKRRIEMEDVFPEGWGPNTPIAHYGARYQINALRCLTATASAKHEIARRFPKPFATITLREAEYWPARNSNKKAWGEAGRWLKYEGLDVVVIPDTHGTGIEGLETFDAAAWDIDLRLALYEAAKVNLGVATGPMALCMVSNAPYIMCNIVSSDGAPAHKVAFLKAHGMEEGGQFSPNGKTVWKKDDAWTLIEELKTWFKHQPLDEVANARI